VKDVRSSDTPALAAFKGTVYLAIKGANDSKIWWASYTAAAGWGAQKVLADTVQSEVGPALAVGDTGLVHLAWKATNGDSISTAHWFSGDGTWSAVTVIPVVETISRPALAFQNSAATDVLLAFQGKNNAIFVGPLDALATEQVKKYTFRFAQFQIKNTRSGNLFGNATDTDYASLAVTVGKGKPQVQMQFMGNLTNGIYPTNLAFGGVEVADDEHVIMTYHIINSSQGQTAAFGYLETAAQKLATAGASAAASAVGDAIGAAVGAALGLAVPVPLVGSALGALAGWLIGDAWGIAFPQCDGQVAAAVHIFTGAELRAMTATGTRVSLEDNPGLNSPDGCGSNSDYVVEWQVGAG
jgi:hypothetical protein